VVSSLLKKVLLVFLLSTTSFADDVCFSPGGKCASGIVNFINSSKKTVDVAIYLLTYKPIADALISQHEKGIVVRVITDKKNTKLKTSLISKLVEAGVPVKYGVQPGIMHDKFIISDSFYLETGSFNFTEAADSKNQENQIYIGSAEIVTKYISRFNSMWSASKSLNK
jgi:phosphatidylserine/phosphatidylglycerophosphate/cardiolipin synthase-like enzyme